MKIELNDTSTFHSALVYAEKHKYYKALNLFAEVESYESLINQLVCLTQIDTPYAVDVYRYLKYKYGVTHAVYADVSLYGDTVEDVLAFCETVPKLAVQCDGKIRADRSLLIDPDRIYEEEVYSTPDLDFDGDSSLIDSDAFPPDGFYDVKSTEYLDYLRINLERCYLRGDDQRAKKFAKRLLEQDTTHMPTLEAQISYLVYSEKFSYGLKYVKRLAATEQPTYAAIGGAIEILMHMDIHKHLDVLKILMDKVLLLLDEITPFDLEDYAYIATTYLKNTEIAYTFAKELYPYYENAGLECLKVCAAAFYNYGDTKLAKEAAIKFNRFVPHDVYGQILLEFIRQTPYQKNQVPMEIAPRQIRHFALPTKLTVFANRQLSALMEKQGEDIKLTEKILFYLSVLILHCKTLILLDHQQEYFETFSLISAILRAFPPEDNSAFFRFATRELMPSMPDQCLSQCLISRMVELGFNQKVFVLRMHGCSTLDFSKINPVDHLYLECVSLCAGLVTISDPENYQKTYVDMCNLVPIEKDDPVMIQHVTYALLKICDKKLLHGDVADYFSEEERTLYKKYCLAKKLNSAD